MKINENKNPLTNFIVGNTLRGNHIRSESNDDKNNELQAMWP